VIKKFLGQDFLYSFENDTKINLYVDKMSRKYSNDKKLSK